MVVRGFLADMSVRILTINMGEEALVRVNSQKPITLEFPGHLVTIYEENGLIFQRVEKQEDNQTQEMDEEEAPGDEEETQFMETQIHTQIDEEEEGVLVPRKFAIPGRYMISNMGPGTLMSEMELQDIYETEIELFGQVQDN